MIASKSVEEKESYDRKYVLVSCKEDGSGVRTTELALKKEEYPGGIWNRVSWRYCSAI